MEKYSKPQVMIDLDEYNELLKIKEDKDKADEKSFKQKVANALKIVFTSPHFQQHFFLVDVFKSVGIALYRVGASSEITLTEIEPTPQRAGGGMSI